MAIFAIEKGSDVGMLFAITCGIYVFFLLLGVGISSFVTYATCEKTDSPVHFKQSAFWALAPSVAYLIIRSFEILRIQFDKLFGSGWISIGYFMLIWCLGGLFALQDYSIEAVCIPSIDEATAFRQEMLKIQAQKAASQETTPAVQTSRPPDTTLPPS